MAYCSTPGYLYRKLYSYAKKEGYRFSFSAGDAISLVISVIIGAFSATVPEAIITALFPASMGSLINSFRGTFDYRTYRYQYRVRVNGEIYFSAVRNEDYWVKLRDNGPMEYEYKCFNYGYSQSNFEMVKAGIDLYMEDQLR